MARTGQCIVRARGKQLTFVTCSTDRSKLRDVLNRCYREAHPTLEECRVIADDSPVLGATKVVGKRRRLDASTRFENGWAVKTRWAADAKEWLTIIENEQGEVVSVEASKHSRAAEGTHGDAVAAVELYAEPGMDEASFWRARSGQPKVDLVSTAAAMAPLSGRRRKRR